MPYADADVIQGEVAKLLTSPSQHPEWTFLLAHPQKTCPLLLFFGEAATIGLLSRHLLQGASTWPAPHHPEWTFAVIIGLLSRKSLQGASQSKYPHSLAGYFVLLPFLKLFLP